MPANDPFADFPVVGAMPEDRAEAKLGEFGEITSRTSEADGPVAFSTFDFLPWRRRLWASTNHLFGYLPPIPPGSGPVPVVHPGSIAPDTSLKGARVRITLDRLRVAQYPGGGTHSVLFDFSARNQVSGEPAELHFNATYRVLEGESAGIVGYPIFVGLPVGDDGLALRCYTVNVKNDQDEALLGFLDGETFQSGLKLITTAQPALAPFSSMAIGLTKAIAGRNRNVPVQDFKLGLDFGGNPLGLRLAVGNYLAVQVPQEETAGWDWAKWEYNPQSGQIVGTGPERLPLPYNYIVFGISRYDGA